MTSFRDEIHPFRARRAETREAFAAIDDRGITAKLGIDATRPFGQSFAEKLVMSPEKMTWARELVDRLAPREQRRPYP